MPEQRARTLTYRRASWSGPRRVNLATVLGQASQVLGTQNLRTFVYQEGEVSGMELTADNGGIFGHIATYTPGEPTSIVPVPKRAARVQTETLDAPDDFNFSEGELFFFLHGNHLVLCPSGAREGACVTFIRQMLLRGGHEGIVPLLDLSPVADLDQVALLRREGVKKVSLNASLFQATVDYHDRRTVRQSVLHGVTQELMAFFTSDRQFANIDPSEYENLSVKLELSFDGRKQVTEAVTDQLERTAEKMITDGEEEGFSIVTSEGKKLSSDQIRVNRQVFLPSFGNSVSKNAAFAALADYYRELRGTGALTQ